MQNTKLDPLTFLDNMHYFPEVAKQYFIADDAIFANMESDVLALFMNTCEEKREQIIDNYIHMITDKYFETNPGETMTPEIAMKLTLLFIKDDIVAFDNDRFFDRKMVEKYLGNVDHEFLVKLVIDKVLE